MKAQWTRSALAATAAAAIAGCGATAAQTPSTTASSTFACSAVTDLDSQVAAVYSPGAVTKVEPLYHKPGVYEGTDFMVRADRPSRHLEGAALYVPAPANTSAAYLERALSCHVAGAGPGAQHVSDPLRVDGVKKVDVRAAGPMFRIDIRAEDRASGKQVLQAARSMQSNVSIMQVASSDGSATF